MGVELLVTINELEEVAHGGEHALSDVVSSLRFSILVRLILIAFTQALKQD